MKSCLAKVKNYIKGINKESLKFLILNFNYVLSATHFTLLYSVHSCSYAYTQHSYKYGHI
jgi:hypothetical protein